MNAGVREAILSGPSGGFFTSFETERFEAQVCSIMSLHLLTSFNTNI